MIGRGVGILGIVFLIAPLIAAQEPNRRTVTGVVTDTTGSPLAYVNVHLGSNRLVTLDSGRVALRSASRGAFKVLLLRIGFEPTEVVISAGADTTIRVAMTPLAVRLAAVQVLGTQMSSKLELRGFYGRMRDVERGINRGYFVTRGVGAPPQYQELNGSCGIVLIWTR